MKPENVERIEQNEYGPIYVDGDSGYAYRGPEYTPRYQALKRAGVDPGWQPLPDGWYQSSKRVQSKAYIAPGLRNVVKAATPGLTALGWTLGAGAALVLALKSKRR